MSACHRCAIENGRFAPAPSPPPACDPESPFRAERSTPPHPLNPFQIPKNRKPEHPPAQIPPQRGETPEPAQRDHRDLLQRGLLNLRGKTFRPARSGASNQVSFNGSSFAPVSQPGNAANPSPRTIPFTAGSSRSNAVGAKHTADRPPVSTASRPTRRCTTVPQSDIAASYVDDAPSCGAGAGGQRARTRGRPDPRGGRRVIHGGAQAAARPIRLAGGRKTKIRKMPAFAPTRRNPPFRFQRNQTGLADSFQPPAPDRAYRRPVCSPSRQPSPTPTPHTTVLGIRS